MIVILTALDVEYAAVAAHLVNPRKQQHNRGTIFNVGTLGTNSEQEIATAWLGMGNVTAGILTERAVEMFQPSALLFTGVAGGMRDWLSLGDVVVASHVYAYHGGKSEDTEFLSRPRSWDISHRIDQAAKHLAHDGVWRRSLPPDSRQPEVHFGPLVAGEAVLNSRRSPLAEHLRRNYNDAIAAEMESSGFSLAGHLNDVPVATVRAISDAAGGDKERTDAEGWQLVAARNAAAFTVSLAAELSDRTGRPAGATADADSPEGSAEPKPTSGPVLRDNAQAAQVSTIHHGSSHFGAGFFGGRS